MAANYESEQAAVLQRLPSGIPHPSTGHVTLRGFFEPDRVPSLRNTIATWARIMSPIDLTAVAIDGFPTPFRVLHVRLERTDSLVRAYASLTDMLETTDLFRIGELALGEWVFHMSLAYASDLGEAEWEEILATSRRELAPPPRETVSYVDFVWYDADGEHIESLSLGMPVGEA